MWVLCQLGWLSVCLGDSVINMLKKSNVDHLGYIIFHVRGAFQFQKACPFSFYFVALFAKEGRGLITFPNPSVFFWLICCGNWFSYLGKVVYFFLGLSECLNLVYSFVIITTLRQSWWTGITIVGVCAGVVLYITYAE